MSAPNNLNDFGNPVVPDPSMLTDQGTCPALAPRSGDIFQIDIPFFAAADVAKVFFVAPFACKVIFAYESHATKAGQAGTLQIEKLASGETATQGDVILKSAFDLASDNSTPVRKDALDSAAAELGAGERLCMKVASGAATSLAGASMSVVLQWA